MSEVELVEIRPFEINMSNRRLKRFYNIWIAPHLNVDLLRNAVTQWRTREEPNVTQNPNNLLAYRYPGKPLLLIDPVNSKFFTTNAELDLFSKAQVCHQASILLGILKRSRLARGNHRTIYFDALGETEEEKNETINLINELTQS